MRTWIRFCTLATLAATLLLGCSRDPNVLKQKYLQSGTRYMQQGKLLEAAIEFQNAIQQDPRYAQAHHELAKCFLRQSLWNGAYHELLVTVNLQPQNTDAQNDLARLLIAGRHFQDAHDRAATSLALQPNNYDAQMVLAHADTLLGNQRLALAELKKAIQTAPNRPEAYLSLALLQARQRQKREAEANFRKAVSLDDKYLPGRLSLAAFYQSLKRWPEAERQYMAAITNAPGNPAPRAALAQLFLNQGRKADAERVLAKAKEDAGDNQGYRMLGDFYIGVGDSERALSEFAALSKTHPNDLSLKRTYVQLLLAQNRAVEATSLNDQILEQNSQDIEALVQRAQILGFERRLEDAVSVLQTAVRAAPENAIAHYSLGIAHNQTGNTVQAESEWNTAARLAPSLAEAQRALATAALRRSDWDSLARRANQLITTQPQAAAGYVYRGTERLMRKDLRGAEVNFRKAIDLAPADPSGYVGLATLRSDQKRFKESEDLLKQALLHEPSSLEALRRLVLLAVREKQEARAIRTVRAQIAKAPSQSGFYVLLADLLQGHNPGAGEAAAQQAAKLDPYNLDALLLIARFSYRRGKVDEAVTRYHQAIQKQPRDVRPLLELGPLEESRGHWQEAQKLYEQVLHLDANNPSAANNLAYILVEHGGDKNVALSLAQSARRSLPGVANTADTLGWAYYHAGAYGSAISNLQEAIKRAPSNPTYRYHLGLSYQKTGEHTRAREEFQRALDLHPLTSQAAEIRRALAASPLT